MNKKNTKLYGSKYAAITTTGRGSRSARPWRCRVTALGKLSTPLQNWKSSNGREWPFARGENGRTTNKGSNLLK